MGGLGLVVSFAASGAVLALAMGWHQLVAWADANPNMAAWVQAIGSVLAILAAVGVGYYQTAQQRRAAQEAAVQRQNTVRATVLSVVRHIGQTVSGLIRVRHEMGDKVPAGFEANAVRDAAAPLSGAPLFEFEDPKLVKAVLDLRRRCAIVTMGLDTEKTDPAKAMKHLLDKCVELLHGTGQEPIVMPDRLPVVGQTKDQ